VHKPRPDEIVGAQQLKGACHLVSGKIAPIPHHALQEMHLAMVDEEGEFTGLGEVGLSGEKSDSRQAVVAGARHSGGGDR